MAKPQNHHRPPPRHHPPPQRHHPGHPPPPSQPPHIYHQQRPPPQQPPQKPPQREQILPVWDHYYQQPRQQQQQLPPWNQQPPQQQRQPQQQPLRQQPPPAAWDPHSPAEIPRRRPPKPAKSKRTTLASCIVATIFLVFLLIILSIVYFSIFKPKPPDIAVSSITLPTFSLSSGNSSAAGAAVSFTFSLYAAVRNPNHAGFSHYDSSLQLIYAGNQVGFMFIPAGEIAAGRTKYMAATFSVQSFPIMSPAGSSPAMVGPPVFDGVNRVSPTMEIEMRMDLEGRVRVFWFFNHHVQNVKECRVAVAINDGSVLGFHC